MKMPLREYLVPKYFTASMIVKIEISHSGTPDGMGIPMKGSRRKTSYH